MPAATKAKGTTIEGKSNLPVNIAAALAKEVEENAKRISAPSGDTIRIMQEKKFKLPTGEENAGPLTAVVVDFAFGNTFYDQPYREGENVAPACFARGLNAKELVPSANAPAPQAESCAKCPNNEFGSNGKGKACTNNAFLAVMMPSDEEDNPLYIIKVSPTAVRGWESYVSALRSKLNTPPIGVTTDIYFDPESKYATLKFGNPQPNPYVASMFGRKQEARERLLAEPDVSAYEAPKKVAVKGRR